MSVNPLTDPAMPSDVRKVLDLPHHAAHLLRALPVKPGTAPPVGKPTFRWGKAATAHQVAKPRRTYWANILSSFLRLSFTIAIFATPTNISFGQSRLTIAHNDNKSANSEFKFAKIPSPSRDDAATHARIMIVDGEADANGGDVTA